MASLLEHKSVFKYSRLLRSREFRLLSVYGANKFEEDVCFTLHHISLENRDLDYEAISYCWGEGQSTETMWCDGQMMAVTKTCARALKQFRPRTKGEVRTLWIDGACIDQTSLEERSQQVAMMGDIFASAKRVLVWLGDPTWQDQTVGGKVEKLNSAFQALVEFARVSGEWNANDTAYFARHVPWFKRIWVIQEGTLAKRATLYYGDCQASLTDILEGYIARESLKDIPDTSAHKYYENSADPLWNLLASHRMALELRRCRSSALVNASAAAIGHFLSEIRFSKATDVKDKVFAIHHILRDAGIDLPLPDYTKSPASVFRAAAAAVLRCTNSLLILEQVDGLGSTPGMTSWAPDWAASKHSIRSRKSWRATALVITTPHFLLHDNDRQLHLQGMELDKIVARPQTSLMHVDEGVADPADYTKWTRNPALPGSVFKDMLASYPRHSAALLYLWNFRVLRDFIHFALGDPPDYTDERQVTALYRCLMSNYKRHGTQSHVNEGKAKEWFQLLIGGSAQEDQAPLEDSWMPDGRQEIRDSLTFLSSRRDFKDIARTEEFRAYQRTEQSPLLGRPQLACTGRARYKTIFRTAKGNLGLAPWSLWPGDKIVRVLGVDFPLILRPHGDCFRLVAHAYVDGYMELGDWSRTCENLQEITLI